MFLREAALNNGGRKTSYFEAKCIISKTVGYIRPKLLLMTNRKLQMRFRLTPTSMTLNCISSNFHRISQISDATTAERMKSSSIVSDNVVIKQLNVFFNIVFLAVHLP